MGSENATVSASGDFCNGVPGPGGNWPRLHELSDEGATDADERLDLSPSLLRSGRGSPPAFEWKFLVDEALAVRIEETLRDSLERDPHGDDRFAGGYSVTTVYFDTPNRDVLRGQGRHKVRKYRLRRYGDSPKYFLERKTKRGTQVRKRRDSVTEDRLATALGIDGALAPDDSRGWFGRQIARQQLHPTCRVQYVRRAYYGSNSEGRLRMTFDRDLCGAPVEGWSLRVTRDDVPILTDLVICEFKFVQAMPSLFKQVIQDLQLSATGFSKYRQGMRIFGGDPTTPPAESFPDPDRDPAPDARSKDRHA